MAQDHDEENDEQFMEDPVQKAKREIREKKVLIADIKQVAQLTDDEIETLFPTIEALKQFHKEMCHLHESESEDHLDAGDDGKAPAEDEHALSADDEQRAKELAGKKRKKALKNRAAKAAFDQAGAHLPPEDRPSSEDLERLLAQLDDEDEAKD